MDWIKARNKSIGIIYRQALKPILFRNDPEKVHDHFVAMGRRLGKNGVTRNFTKLLFYYRHPLLEQTIAGIRFPNPVGLSAGFDKNAQLIDILPSVGFGFIEVGSITGEPCAGNPKPRLWRLPEHKSLRVHYGLKNDGAIEIAKRLAHVHKKIPVGVSIAKTNCAETVDTEKGINDYQKAYQSLFTYGDYITINISCPNAYGGEPFTDPKLLDGLLHKLDLGEKPVFLKLSPDLSFDEIDAILKVCNKYPLRGFICTNLTKNVSNLPVNFPVGLPMSLPGKGGVSGKLVEQKSNELIRYVYEKTKGKYILIGCGGIFCAEDAYEKIKLGCSLVQLITGMVYQGPQVISEINQNLVRLAQEDGFSSISEAVGKAYNPTSKLK